MSRRKHKKAKVSNDSVTVTPCNALVTQNQKHLQILKHEYDIQFVPLVIDLESGHFENIHLFQQLLPVLEETSCIFGDDSMPKVDNYTEWLQYSLGFIESVQPWMFIVLVDGKPQGFMWATGWAGNGPGIHSVSISGANKRKTPIDATTQALKKFISLIFENTPVYIIRGEYTEDNRAAGLALTRAGLSHPEKQRVTMIRNGQEVTGIIKSITRPEWEAKHV